MGNGWEHPVAPSSSRATNNLSTCMQMDSPSSITRTDLQYHDYRLVIVNKY